MLLNISKKNSVINLLITNTLLNTKFDLNLEYDIHQNNFPFGLYTEDFLFYLGTVKILTSA